MYDFLRQFFFSISLEKEKESAKIQFNSLLAVEYFLGTLGLAFL